MNRNILNIIIELQHCKPLMAFILLLRLCGIIPLILQRGARDTEFILLSQVVTMTSPSQRKWYLAISNKGKFQSSAQKGFLSSCYIPVLGEFPAFFYCEVEDKSLFSEWVIPKSVCFFPQNTVWTSFAEGRVILAGIPHSVNLNSSSTERGCWTSPPGHCCSALKRACCDGHHARSLGLKIHSQVRRLCSVGSPSVHLSPLRVPSKSPWKGKVDSKSDFLQSCPQTLAMLPQPTTSPPLFSSSNLGHIAGLSICLLWVVDCPKQKRNVKSFIQTDLLILFSWSSYSKSSPSFSYTFPFTIYMGKTHPRLKLDLHTTHEGKKS